MQVDAPPEAALNELKRYTEDLLSFFDSKAAVEISTSQEGKVLVEITCKPFMKEQKVSLIALEVILTARMTTLLPSIDWKINLSVKSSILINY